MATKTEESSNENYQGITSSISLDVPVGTAFIQVICDYVMFFPIFTDIQVMSGEGVLTYTESAASQARNWPDYWNLYSAINDFSPVAVLTVSGPTNITVYPGKDDQPSDPTMEASLNEKYPGYINRAHVVFDELQLEDFGNRIPNMMFEVVQYDDMRLSRALEELMGRAGVAEDNYDISGIPPKGVASHVLGYSIGSKTNYRAAMETLLEAFRIDVAEIGDELVFRQRNRQPDYIIDRRHIAATVAGSKPGAKVKLTYRDEVEMPRVLNVKFKDPERDYQQNNTIYRRQQGVSVGDTAVELAAVMPPHIAKEYARDKMRDIWLERVSAGVSLPHEYIYIFPSDIVFVDGQYTNDDSFTMKVTSAMRGANGLLEIEGVLRETTIYIPPDDYDEQSSMSDTWTGGQTSTTNVPGTVLALFDLPPIGVDSEEENTFGFYYAMGGSPGWRGGTVYRDTFEDGTYRGLGSSDNPATMGQTLEAPGFGTVDLLDTENTILVRMRTKSDELFSITATELLNGFNSAIVGNEIIQFMTAELIESRVYRLSNLLRGRRNTDLQSIVSGHTTGETFILLDGAGLRNYKDTAILAGLPLDYRGVAYGASVSDVPDVSFTNTDLRRTPRPPVWVRSERDGSNNITIEWYRQDRVHAIWERYADLRLGEDTEAYEIDIMSGATVVRTITGLTAPLAVYTATDQTTDGFVAGDPVEVKIYQMSAAIGRGIPAEEIV